MLASLRGALAIIVLNDDANAAPTTRERLSLSTNYRYPFILDAVCHLPALLVASAVAWLVLELTGSGFVAGFVWMLLWSRTMDRFMAATFAVLKSRWPTVPDPQDPYLESLRNQTRWWPSSTR